MNKVMLHLNTEEKKFIQFKKKKKKKKGEVV